MRICIWFERKENEARKVFSFFPMRFFMKDSFIQGIFFEEPILCYVTH